MIQLQLMQEYSNDILNDNKNAVRPVRVRSEFCSDWNDHDDVGIFSGQTQ